MQNGQVTQAPGEKTSKAVERPFILPDVFTGERDFNDWIQSFESVAAVNRWDDKAKCQWLHVHTTRKACLVPT